VNRFAIWVVIFVLIVISSPTSHVMAQTTTTSVSEIVVASTSSPPSIDGQWQQGEWNSSVEYQLMLGSQNLNGQPHPYLRLTHDESKIYGWIDVPSDNGKFYVDSKGVDNWGAVSLTFYNGPGFISNHTIWVEIVTNQTQRVTASLFTFSIWNWTKNPDIVSGATTLTTTVHSNVEHRVWEFSTRLRPYVTNSSLNGDLLGISFDITVQDSSGNSMYLVASRLPATMDFAATPVPENVNVYIALPTVMLLSLVVFIRSRRRLR